MKRATSTRPPTSHIAPFGLRLQHGLRAKLEAAATESGRSLNAEITERLVASFESQGPETWSEDSVSKALIAALERIDSLERNLKEMIDRGEGERVRRVLAKEPIDPAPDTEDKHPALVPFKRTKYSEYAKTVLETGREPNQPTVKRIRRTRPKQG